MLAALLLKKANDIRIKPALKLCNATTPTIDNFDLAATFINFTKFQTEGYRFDQFADSVPQQQEGAMAEYLTTERGWNFSKQHGDDCHVRHNPAYTSCLKTGSFWFDSPLFNEMGCYTTSNFIEVLRRKSPYLRDLDLQYFREHGYCMRYKEKMYQNITNPAPPTTVIEGSEEVDRNSTATAQTVMPPQSSPTTVVEGTKKGRLENLGGELKTILVEDSRIGPLMEN